MEFQLMHHQEEAVNFALQNNGIAAFFHDVGCGKTLSALTTFAELRKKDTSLKMLVICPLSLIYGAWVREIEKFTDYNWDNLHSEKHQCRRSGHIDIVLINFESLVYQKRLEKLMVVMRVYKNWMCVIDESSKLKNNRAKTVEKILELKKYFKHRIIMSGTPAPNVEWEYWPQMFFLDESILGNNFYKFKNTHFALRRGNQSMAPGVVMNAATIRKMHEQGYKYEIIPAKKEQMFKRMKPWCHMVKASDCIDLPEEIDEYRMIQMTEVQHKIYKQMEKAYIAELGEDKFAVANIVLSKMMKLRQITAGFVVDDKQNPTPVSPTNPKMEELFDVIDECGQNQVIIWCQFHWEMDQIEQRIKDRGETVSLLHGRVPYGQRQEHLENFLTGKSRFLIAHPDSAAHGLTLTNCHIAIFYSLDYSMEGYTQARGRIYRNGQKNNCVYFHLLASGTIDEDVLKIVQRKETAQDLAAKYLVSHDNKI